MEKKHMKRKWSTYQTQRGGKVSNLGIVWERTWITAQPMKCAAQKGRRLILRHSLNARPFFLTDTIIICISSCRYACMWYYMGIQTVHKKHSDFKFMRGYCIIKRTESSTAVSVRGLTMFNTVVCHGNSSGPGGSPFEIQYVRKVMGSWSKIVSGLVNVGSHAVSCNLCGRTHYYSS